jgi:lysophospholipase L1-like esterase
LVERKLPKLEVAGSRPVSRSTLRRVLRWCLMAIAAGVCWALAGAAGAVAQGVSGPFLTGETSRTGYVNLIYFGSPGTHVSFFERVGERRVPLGAGPAGPEGFAPLHPAATWRCGRLVRSFESVARTPGGVVRENTFDIRTPSCRDRLRLLAPARVRPHSKVRVRVRDRWALGGLSARACAHGPSGQRRCRALTLAHGTSEAAARLPISRRGQWRLSVRLAGHRTVRPLGVGVAARTRRSEQLARVLATGDSTIEGIESYLADELSGLARVRREFHVGTGISKPGAPAWTARARRQAISHRPAVTVISIGAVDGHAMNGVACCGAAWQAEYSRRAGRMMRSYRRGGKGRVLWLTLPIARDPGGADVARAVNAAVVRAARWRSGVRLVRLDEIFTPGGTFRESMAYRGRMVKVRSGDGIHLTAAGTAIAARAAANTLKAWPRALGSPRR